MKIDFLKEKRTWYIAGSAVIIIVILLLLKNCSSLDADGYKSKVEDLIEENKSDQEEWNLLLDDTTFEDLCTEPYAKKFEDIGKKFIDRSNEFHKLKVSGEPESIIPNYQDYKLYFETYEKIGEKLISFAKNIRNGEYDKALIVIQEIKALNNQLPEIK